MLLVIFVCKQNFYIYLVFRLFSKNMKFVRWLIIPNSFPLFDSELWSRQICFLFYWSIDKNKIDRAVKWKFCQSKVSFRMWYVCKQISWDNWKTLSKKFEVEKQRKMALKFWWILATHYALLCKLFNWENKCFK